MNNEFETHDTPEKKQHISFILESSHGHVNPTLGITSQLVELGYHVSYAVKEYFAPRVIAQGAEALIYRPLGAKRTIYSELQKIGRSDPFTFTASDMRKFLQGLRLEMSDTLRQLRLLYQDDKPDLIIYDGMNLAGRALASSWSIPALEYSSALIDPSKLQMYDRSLVLVSLPVLFQKDAEQLGGQFHFVGPVYNDGRFFKPWKSAFGSDKTILISATTELLPQRDFFLKAIQAFRNTSFRIVLSIGDELDASSLGQIPPQFQINRDSSHPDILKNSCLFIGQGGPSSTLEAFRFGVPVIAAPPSQAHDAFAVRVEELGLGVRLLPSNLFEERLRESAVSLMQNSAILNRVKQIQNTIREMKGAERAASLIRAYLDTNHQAYAAADPMAH